MWECEGPMPGSDIGSFRRIVLALIALLFLGLAFNSISSER